MNLKNDQPCCFLFNFILAQYYTRPLYSLYAWYLIIGHNSNQLAIQKWQLLYSFFDACTEWTFPKTNHSFLSPHFFLSLQNMVKNKSSNKTGESSIFVFPKELFSFPLFNENNVILQLKDRLLSTNNIFEHMKIINSLKTEQSIFCFSLSFIPFSISPRQWRLEGYSPVLHSLSPCSLLV